MATEKKMATEVGHISRHEYASLFSQTIVDADEYFEFQKINDKSFI